MVKTCILLTSTIRPHPDVPIVAVKDVAEREKQYINAIEFYIKAGIPIVFCDNSNTQSEKILNIGKRCVHFEYLFFMSVESYKGKGNGEKEIFDYVFEHSYLLNNCDWVIKISGRYIIENIMQLISDAEKFNADVIANLGRNLSWADTRIMFIKRNFYFDYFKPFLEKNLKPDAEIYFEKIYARSVCQLIADNGRYQPWIHYPFYKAINGASGDVIKFSSFRKIKFRIYWRVKKWVFRQIV